MKKNPQLISKKMNTAIRKSVFFLLFSTALSAYSASVVKTVPVCTAGSLSTLLTSTELTTVTKLSITSGTVNAVDFKVLKSMTKLDTLDLAGVSIAAYSGTGGTGGTTSISYPANEVPTSGMYAKSVLKYIALPATTSSIGSSAFRNCTNLAGVQIPAQVTTIGSRAFTGCVNAFFTVNALNTSFSADASGVLFDKNKTLLIQGSLIKTSYTIPSSVKTIGTEAFYNSTLTGITLGSNIQSIENSAFDNCKSLGGALTLPQSVTRVGAKAFYYCSSLSGISFTGAVDSIQTNTFSYCKKLGTIGFPAGLKFIGTSAFSQCDILDGLTFPSSLDSIGTSAFYSCLLLKTITFPANLRTISQNSFAGCTQLTSVSLPLNLRRIDSTAFFTTGLKSIIIPEGVTRIGGSAFNFCTSLQSVSIPSTVTRIGATCFAYCSALSTINAFPATPPDLSLSPDVFLNVDKTSCTLYVPAAKVSLYQNSVQWKDFSNTQPTIISEEPSVEQPNNTICYTPSTSVLHLNTLPKASVRKVVIMQLDGKTVFSQQTTADEVQVNLTTKGIYVVRVSGMDSSSTQKIIVQ